MSRPTSLRLPDELRARLENESRQIASPVASLAVSLLDEGLKMRQFSGIVFRDGPAGRRAGLAKGPDVWEIVRDLKRARGTTLSRVDLVAEEAGLAPEAIGLAADYYAAFPDEIDARIDMNERVAAELREIAERRERLLTT
ncbi:CopG family transcriptional regulator [Candidatus Poriferisodalis sp.]|uniref:CopG family transcriptional regulator n=1 Tax=Candidatus Poriferisodalis sp. TaxID=3101277 RepID=UPI003B0215D5